MSMITVHGNAEGQDKWVELNYGTSTTTYDLSSVREISPGKFTIIGTTIDEPEVMRLRLKANDVLRSYCNSPDGEYPSPTDALAMGQPDMPIEKIKVTSRAGQPHGEKFKSVSWRLPFRKLARSNGDSFFVFLIAVLLKKQPKNFI
jgi:hypothetical protein